MPSRRSTSASRMPGATTSSPQMSSTPGREQFGLLDADTQALTFGVNCRRVRVRLRRDLRATRPTAPCSGRGTRIRRRSRVARSDPRLDPRQRREGQYLDALRRHAQGRSRRRIFASATTSWTRTTRSSSGAPHRAAQHEHIRDRQSTLSGGRVGLLHPFTRSRPPGIAFTADVKYFFTTDVGIGFAYWYEKLNVIDFATIDSNGSVGFTPATGVYASIILAG